MMPLTKSHGQVFTVDVSGLSIVFYSDQRGIAQVVCI